MNNIAKISSLLAALILAQASWAETPSALRADLAGPPPAIRLNETFTVPSEIEAASKDPAVSDDIVVLPTFDVRDSRLRLTERDVLTSKELLARAKARYLSRSYQATFGQLSAALGILANLPSILQGWRPNDAEAATLFAQDERLRVMRESEDLIELVKDTDPAAYKELKRVHNTTFRFQNTPSTRRGE